MRNGGNMDRDAILSKLKSKNPEWGRKRLSKESGIPTTSVQRWLNKNRQADITIPGNKGKLLSRLADNLSDREIRAILNNLSSINPEPEPFELSKESFKFGVMSDTHIGHSCFNPNWLFSAYDFFAQEDVDFVYHAGDICEGMSGRDGQIYELNKIGFEEQVGYAAELLAQCPVDIRAILGNHDQWYKIKGNLGACVGSRLASELDNFTYLGDDEAVDTVSGVNIMLRHPGDGSAYAQSYKLQQFINSLSGGKKPHIILNGHYHKSIAMTYRNVHAFESMTLQGQSKFMRGRNLASVAGVWVIEVWPDAQGVQRIKSEGLHFYE